MPTCLYEQSIVNGKLYWRKSQELKLAGRNIIWNLWRNRGDKVPLGWEARHDDILSLMIEGDFTVDRYRILVNVLPHREGEIELLLLDEICVYTDGREGSDEAEWSIYMLKTRQFLHRHGIDANEKTDLTDCFPDPGGPGQEVTTFLYMHGDDKGWKPGPVNATAGALFYPRAREYFRKHF